MELSPEVAMRASVGQKSAEITWNNTVEMLSVIPPIFILLGLLDVWVQRETMIKLMMTMLDKGVLQ